MPGKRRTYEEDRIQAAIVAWIRAVAPQVRVFAIPNGGKRTRAEAGKLKWMGVLPGVPDLCVLRECGQALFIEVKTADGDMSREQDEFANWLLDNAYPFAVCRNIDKVRRCFALWGIKTREANAA